MPQILFQVAYERDQLAFNVLEFVIVNNTLITEGQRHAAEFNVCVRVFPAKRT